MFVLGILCTLYLYFFASFRNIKLNVFLIKIIFKTCKHDLLQYYHLLSHTQYHWCDLFCLLVIKLNIFITFFSPRPKIDLKEYDVIILALGGAHNLFCGLVLLTYFLSNHPTLPSISGMITKIRYEQIRILITNIVCKKIICKNINFARI